MRATPRFKFFSTGKRQWPFVALLSLLLLGAGGCAKKEVDTAKLQSTFQSALPGVRSDIDAGIADINASNYAAALQVLQHAAFAGKLTPDQATILKDSMKIVRSKIK